MRVFAAPTELAAAAGAHLGDSDWHLISQEQVDRFADDTGDRQWIHTDLTKAATGPFGGTVAHGFLLLALIPVLLDEVFHVGGTQLVINKELRRARFLTPVPVGCRIRATVELTAARLRPRGFCEAEFTITAEIESVQKPAFTAEQVFLYQHS